MVANPIEDTEPHVQLLFYGSYWETDMWSQDLLAWGSVFIHSPFQSLLSGFFYITTKMKYYLEALDNYFVFSGRSSRKAFWMFHLVNTVIAICIVIVEVMLGLDSNNNGGPIYLGYQLLILIPAIAIAVRRMHDVNKSGWYTLLPIYNLILFCSKSVHTNNHYISNDREEIKESPITHKDVTKNDRSWTAITSLVLGIVSVLLWEFSLIPILAIIFGIVALVSRSDKKWQAWVGIALGILFLSVRFSQGHIDRSFSNVDTQNPVNEQIPYQLESSANKKEFSAEMRVKCSFFVGANTRGEYEKIPYVCFDYFNITSEMVQARAKHLFDNTPYNTGGSDATKK